MIHTVPGGSEVNASVCNAEDLGSIPGLGRSPGEGNGNPLQYSCLENPMGGGARWATVHGVAKSLDTTEWLHFHFHTVKGFGLVNKAEIDVFLELSYSFNDPADVGNLISGSSTFLKSSLNIWKFIVHILLKLPWRILGITLLACEMSAIVQ